MRQQSKHRIISVPIDFSLRSSAAIGSIPRRQPLRVAGWRRVLLQSDCVLRLKSHVLDVVACQEEQ